MTAEHLYAGFSADQVREAERPLLEAGEPLMARAAAGLAAVVREVLAQRRGGPGRLLVLAGSGNNGGDALFAVAELLHDGGSATVVPLGARLHEAGLAAARSAGAAVLPAGAGVSDVLALAASADVILDGILGTGAAASPALRPPASDVVAALLPVVAAGTPVVAVDLPSGIGPDDGAVTGPVLPALITVTFGAVKAGLLLPPGRDLAGTVRLVDIGLGPRLADVEPLVRP
ncbi:MAG: NAD(P)H-hydrate epimerase [Microbacteriaceae bacterium]|nr:NAD(P)H-hydrate epimerase [Microbacteriaceae bacterium]